MLWGPARLDFSGKPQEGLLGKVLCGLVTACGPTEKAQELRVVVLEGEGNGSASVEPAGAI